VALEFLFAPASFDDDVGRSSDVARIAESSEAARRVARGVYDATLLRRIAEGDGDALDELLRAYARSLFNVAYRMLQSAELAQDVVQDVFMHLWVIRATLEVHGSVGAYLTRAVRNRALNVRVHEQSQRNIETRTQALYEYVEPRVPATGESEVLSAEFRAALSEALATLSPRVREVFLLRVDQDLSYAEIAEVLNVTVATVRTQMYRATQELSVRLADWSPG
jgi:RNA polymerase sigma-70 factor (ECF subfamily)